MLLWMGRTMYRHRTRREEELSVEELQNEKWHYASLGFCHGHAAPFVTQC